MTIDEVKYRVDQIEKVASDFEDAHSKEDNLHQDVLRHLADHASAPEDRDLARAALESTAIEFGRYCA